MSLVAQNKTDSQGKKHGKWVKYYDTNAKQVRYEGQFDHGIPVGTFVYYYPNGKKEIENTFRGKTGNCFSKQYDEQENLSAEGLYINRKKDSTWTYFGLKQQLLSREDYKQDVRHGITIVYYPEGQLAEKTRYVEGVKDGEWIQKYGDGKLKAKGTYVSGSLNGEVTYYDLNGRPSYKGSYKNGLKVGKWYTFENGKVTKKEIFEQGTLLEAEES
jgi:antitoxin component YwqK of YwqJK toxin-antitoxin module